MVVKIPKNLYPSDLVLLQLGKLIAKGRRTKLTTANYCQYGVIMPVKDSTLWYHQNFLLSMN